MRIAFLSYHSGLSYRGAETFVHEVAFNLTRMGHEVAVFQGSDISPAGTNYQIKKISNTADFPIRDGAFDVVIPTNGRTQSVKAKLWALQNRKKILISGQSGIGLDDRINLYTFPDIFVCLTKFQQNWCRGVNPWVRSVVVPNGVNTEKFSEKGEKYSHGLKSPVILCVGALSKKEGEISKRQDLLIRAVAKLDHASLLLVGSENGQSELRAMGVSLLGERFKVLSLPYDEMPKVYRACDIFAYPTSKEESYGISILEAMASGLPVVATDDPIRKEIVSKGGELVDPVNINEFAKVLKNVLDNRKRYKPVDLTKNLSWRLVSQSYDKLLKELFK